jgi:hypothetical protein
VTWLRLGFVVVGFQLLGASLAGYGLSVVATSVASCSCSVCWRQRAGTVGAAIPRPEFGNPAVRREISAMAACPFSTRCAELLYLTTDNLLIGPLLRRRHGGEVLDRRPLVSAPSFSFLVVPISALTPLFTSMDARGEAERSRQALQRIVGIASVLAVTACLCPAS